MKNACITAKQAANENGQHLGVQVDRLKTQWSLTNKKRCFSATGSIVTEYCKRSIWKTDRLSTLQCTQHCNFSIEDEPRFGRPTEVYCNQLKKIIDQDRNFSTSFFASARRM